MSNPEITIEMENGKKIVAELYPEIAPNTVNNFISLVKKGFYDAYNNYFVEQLIILRQDNIDGRSPFDCNFLRFRTDVAEH